ncbi:hypothetical protein J5N97_018543 [Dioscorea zingiberensis]|uniref:Uncharacterized protein n=1 Tax=Dioscorea zingiberensis TaxID=325984 RepID=A0A9D5CCV1_9LILI|nr:hypothetical protein J5N97_018543 [Dioscorea zingiberensis]
MGSTGEPDRKRRHFSSISPTAATAAKKQPLFPSSSSEDKKFIILTYLELLFLVRNFKALTLLQIKFANRHLAKSLNMLCALGEASEVATPFPSSAVLPPRPHHLIATKTGRSGHRIEVRCMGILMPARSRVWRAEQSWRSEGIWPVRVMKERERKKTRFSWSFQQETPVKKLTKLAEELAKSMGEGMRSSREHCGHRAGSALSCPRPAPRATRAHTARSSAVAAPNGASCPTEEDFLSRLMETGATERCSGCVSPIVTEEHIQTRQVAARNTTRNIISSINGIWSVNDKLATTLLMTLSEHELGQHLQKTTNGLRADVKNLRSGH